MGAQPAGRRMREPSRGAARAISAKSARKAVAPAADPAAVAAAAEDGAAGAGAGSSTGATMAPPPECCGARGCGETDRCGAVVPATSTTTGAVERLRSGRLAEGAGVAVAALATAPPPRRWRVVFRCCAGFSEEDEAGSGAARSTVVATLRATVVGASAAGAVGAVVRSTARRTVPTDRWAVLTTGATARWVVAWTEATTGCPLNGPLAWAELAAAAPERTHASSRPARPTRQVGQERLAHINIRSFDSPKFGVVIHPLGNFCASRRWG
jgi:hypothetical protein